MDPTSRLSAEQREAIAALGLKFEEIERFQQGRPVAYKFKIDGPPVIAILQKTGSRLRSGIVSVNDPGAGLLILLHFRTRTLETARILGFSEVELFGAAVINQRLAEVLLRRGFKLIRNEACPDELGNETMDILSSVLALS